MKSKQVVYILVLSIIIVLGYILYTNASQARIDKLAKCLTDKGVIFYGASWCEHCKAQKEILGASMKYVNYFECSTDETKPIDVKCSELNIARFPTWWLSKDDKLEGIYKPATLAEHFKCSY
jgi:thiol-disulfide isomerase/thioredoxin